MALWEQHNHTRFIKEMTHITTRFQGLNMDCSNQDEPPRSSTIVGKWKLRFAQGNTHPPLRAFAQGNAHIVVSRMWPSPDHRSCSQSLSAKVFSVGSSNQSSLSLLTFKKMRTWEVKEVSWWRKKEVENERSCAIARAQLSPSTAPPFFSYYNCGLQQVRSLPSQVLMN